eukprot:TRINITY_DN2357_c1_g1_i1.p1 TRINITY_DN2357_c1_g1~~TRINITY_DN2357_c1_g1_i1.p1  ORF type:complete len:275 (-),score=66.58 TRINITY_DN2357_c1_g1_i1:21-845(-)
MDENTSLIIGTKPTAQLNELSELIDDLWNDKLEDNGIFGRIAERLREIEGSVGLKYQQLPPSTQKHLNAGEFKETAEIVSELNGWAWIWRFPSLLLTVVIASSCIPLAETLDEVIVNHPILGGFPPAISAAAGCIGIQNTAIIIRALGLKLMKPTAKPFFKFMGISFALSFAAAIIQAIIAWGVLMLREEQSEKAPWQLIVQDVPIVIFIAMLVTGTLAGVIGAGIPILINYISLKTKKHLDPAHWVGPIETVAQEFAATFLTFYIASAVIFND